jgi:hypothetical protein
LDLFDPQIYIISGVYDNLEDAIIDGCNDTVENYLQICIKSSQSTCPYTNIMTHEFIGMNDRYQKGFLQNLSIWDVLKLLCKEVKNQENYLDDIEDSKEFVISRIDHKLFDYPERIISNWMKI